MATERKQRERGDVIFANQLVTMADLENFKSDILDEIRKIVKVDHGLPTKKWLKSSEVRKLLDISPGKLHWLRSNRQLEFMRIETLGYGTMVPPSWSHVNLLLSEWRNLDKGERIFSLLFQ